MYKKNSPKIITRHRYTIRIINNQSTRLRENRAPQSKAKLQYQGNTKKQNLSSTEEY